MKLVCAWCGVTLKAAPGVPDAPVSHGMCEVCAIDFEDDDDTLVAFLARVDVPVVALGDHGAVLDANQLAAALLGKDYETIGRARGVDERGGDLLECPWARRSGGCGEQEHCQACTIRRTVESTMKDGTPRIDGPCYQDVMTDEGPVRQRFVVSTERIRGVVFLRFGS